jgi:glycerol-3-phosphate acyltransferase PlsX
VKSHGGADGEGFASALGLAYVMAQSDFLNEIRRNLDKFAEFEEQDVAAVS